MGHEIHPTFGRALAVNVSAADQSMNVDAGMPYARSFIIGGAGNLAIVTPGNDTVTLAVPVGQIYVSAITVKKSGTTATNITALY